MRTLATLILGFGLLFSLGCSECDCEPERHSKCDLQFAPDRLSDPDRYDPLLDSDGDGELSSVDVAAWLGECR